MIEGVNEQAIAEPEKNTTLEGFSNKELNFRRLEESKEIEKEARIRAEMEAQYLRQQLEEIKHSLQPKEQDPLDGIDDYIDANVLRAKLEKERALLKKEAREIAKQTIQEEREQEEKRNFFQRLKNKYSDYDQVMNEANVITLQKTDPVFYQSVLEVQDDYKRRDYAYQKIKSMQTQTPKVEEKPSVKEIVAENFQNPYYIPSNVATPSAISAVDFDVKSKAAREQAYAKLKANQRRPISNGLA